MDLVLFRRVSTAVMVLLMTAFLVSAVVGAVRGGHPTGLTLSLAGVAIVAGLVVAAMRSLKFAGVAKDIDTRGPLPVFGVRAVLRIHRRDRPGAHRSRTSAHGHGHRRSDVVRIHRPHVEVLR
ncbi:hypothetical protein LFM09_24210 [Lentzea alba]|uniref:hypothetical protein n=1 Tax=Lentzea alba TaxID=2714351 RepID=UPI0039BF68D4